MYQIVRIWLENAEKTESCGQSLAASLYGPTDIFLSGELGAGKTTFLTGFSRALGIPTHLTSPTYALEQRYQTAREQELLHIDLYRLTEMQAKELISQTDHHQGIRCIEWAERLGAEYPFGIHIHLADTEANTGRNITIRFADIPLPSKEQVKEWRAAAMLPPHIAAHCDAVAAFCDDLADILLAQGMLVRKEALHRAAELHDLFRFIDFKKGAAHDPDHDLKCEPAIWETWRARFSDMRHEAACDSFLREHGYKELGEIIAVHGLHLPSPERQTIEQKLLYYADKRLIVDTRVSLLKRFEDFMQRYGNGEWSSHGTIWYAEAKAIEQELFGEKPPV